MRLVKHDGDARRHGHRTGQSWATPSEMHDPPSLRQLIVAFSRHPSRSLSTKLRCPRTTRCSAARTSRARRNCSTGSRRSRCVKASNARSSGSARSTSTASAPDAELLTRADGRHRTVVGNPRRAAVRGLARHGDPQAPDARRHAQARSTALDGDAPERVLVVHEAHLGTIAHAVGQVHDLDGPTLSGAAVDLSAAPPCPRSVRPARGRRLRGRRSTQPPPASGASIRTRQRPGGTPANSNSPFRATAHCRVPRRVSDSNRTARRPLSAVPSAANARPAITPVAGSTSPPGTRTSPPSAPTAADVRRAAGSEDDEVDPPRGRATRCRAAGERRSRRRLSPGAPNQRTQSPDASGSRTRSSTFGDGARRGVVDDAHVRAERRHAASRHVRRCPSRTRRKRRRRGRSARSPRTGRVPSRARARGCRRDRRAGRPGSMPGVMSAPALGRASSSAPRRSGGPAGRTPSSDATTTPVRTTVSRQAAHHPDERRAEEQQEQHRPQSRPSTTSALHAPRVPAESRPRPRRADTFRPSWQRSAPRSSPSSPARPVRARR